MLQDQDRRISRSPDHPQCGLEAATRLLVAVIKLGLVTPLTGKTGYLQVAAASTMGVATAKENGYLNGTDIM